MRTLAALACLVPLSLFAVACDEEPLPPEEQTPPFIDPALDDAQPVVISDVRPPPISGGTLALSLDGKRAIAADPDRDRIVITRVTPSDASASATFSADVDHEIELEPGDEPGRVVVDASGLAHVALRRGGAIVSIDPASGELLARREVCAAPRGMAAFHAIEDADFTDDTLLVACASGELVEVSADPFGNFFQETVLDPDLRDVVLTGDGTRAGRRVLVSSFRSASVTTLGPDGAVERVSQPAGYESTFTARRFAPTVAWRLVPAQDGALMIHQRSATVPLVPVSPDAPAVYYEAMDCGNSVVHAAATRFDLSGARTTAPNAGGLGTFGLPVDVAFSANDASLAGSEGMMFFVSATGQSINAVSQASLGDGFDGCASGFFTGTSRVLSGEPIAVSSVDLNGSSLVAVQLREPSMIVFYDPFLTWQGQVVLGGERRADSGHKLFHGNPDAPTATIACASCHPEGRDDGHVWQFEGVGKRRTQSLEGNVMDTAPFHWSGDLPDMSHLMSDVFVDRMRGQPQSERRVEALGSWLREVPTVGSAPPRAMSSVERGKALFESNITDCSTCHSGERLTDNTTVDVGTGEALQVPGLKGLRNRAPYMHDGCAQTLHERFDPSCGGTKHGKIDQLDEADIDDLVAYMMSL